MSNFLNRKSNKNHIHLPQQQLDIQIQQKQQQIFSSQSANYRQQPYETIKINNYAQNTKIKIDVVIRDDNEQNYNRQPINRNNLSSFDNGNKIGKWQKQNSRRENQYRPHDYKNKDNSIESQNIYVKSPYPKNKKQRSMQSSYRHSPFRSEDYRQLPKHSHLSSNSYQSDSRVRSNQNYHHLPISIRKQQNDVSMNNSLSQNQSQMLNQKPFIMPFTFYNIMQKSNPPRTPPNQDNLQSNQEQSTNDREQQINKKIHSQNKKQTSNNQPLYFDPQPAPVPNIQVRQQLSQSFIEEQNFHSKQINQSLQKFSQIQTENNHQHYYQSQHLVRGRSQEYVSINQNQLERYNRQQQNEGQQPKHSQINSYQYREQPQQQQQQLKHEKKQQNLQKQHGQQSHSDNNSSSQIQRQYQQQKQQQDEFVKRNTFFSLQIKQKSSNVGIYDGNSSNFNEQQEYDQISNDGNQNMDNSIDSSRGQKYDVTGNTNLKENNNKHSIYPVSIANRFKLSYNIQQQKNQKNIDIEYSSRYKSNISPVVKPFQGYNEEYDNSSSANNDQRNITEPEKSDNNQSRIQEQNIKTSQIQSDQYNKSLSINDSQNIQTQNQLQQHNQNEQSQKKYYFKSHKFDQSLQQNQHQQRNQLEYDQQQAIQFDGEDNNPNQRVAGLNEEEDIGQYNYRFDEDQVQHNMVQSQQMNTYKSPKNSRYISPAHSPKVIFKQSEKSHLVATAPQTSHRQQQPKSSYKKQFHKQLQKYKKLFNQGQDKQQDPFKNTHQKCKFVYVNLIQSYGKSIKQRQNDKRLSCSKQHHHKQHCFSNPLTHEQFFKLKDYSKYSCEGYKDKNTRKINCNSKSRSRSKEAQFQSNQKSLTKRLFNDGDRKSNNIKDSNKLIQKKTQPKTIKINLKDKRAEDLFMKHKNQFINKLKRKQNQSRTQQFPSFNNTQRLNFTSNHLNMTQNTTSRIKKDRYLSPYLQEITQRLSTPKKSKFVCPYYKKNSQKFIKDRFFQLMQSHQNQQFLRLYYLSSQQLHQIFNREILNKQINQIYWPKIVQTWGEKKMQRIKHSILQDKNVYKLKQELNDKRRMLGMDPIK